MDLLFWISRGIRGYIIFWTCIVLGIMLLVSAVVPLTVVYNLDDLSLKKTESCPSTQVRTNITRHYRPWGGVLGEVRKVRATSVWQDLETGNDIPIPVSTVYPNIEGEEWAFVNKERITSPVIRVAPPFPGHYGLSTTYEVWGRTLILPDRTEIERKADNNLRVYPENSKMCRI